MMENDNFDGNLKQENPLKKQKTNNNNDNDDDDNNNIKSATTNEEINQILKQINFQDKSISNLLKIYNVYEKYPQPQYESIRMEAVEYFYEYHTRKIPQLFDVKSYIKFMVNVFYDSFDMPLNARITMDSDILLLKICNEIINDKRFGQSDKFRKKIESIKEIYDTKLLQIIDLSINQHKINMEHLYKELCIETHNTINHTNNNNNKRYVYLSNYLIDKIIGFVFEDYPDLNISPHEEVYLKNREILNLSLVSKQFIKILSKQLFEFPLLVPTQIELDNNNGNNVWWSFNYNSPKVFDYESFRYIKYNWCEKQLNSIFSNIETFIITTDEYDSSSVGTARELEEFYYDEYTHYQESIREENYIIYPPQMPSLKKLIINAFYGFENNYSNLISYVIKTNSKSSLNNSKDIDCSIDQSNGNHIGTIEHFSIIICTDWNSEPDEVSSIVFFQDLLNFHSNSLKIIEIDFCSRKYSAVLEFLEIFKKFAATTTITNKINFILKVDSIDIDCKKDYHTNEFKELCIFLKNQK